MHIKPLPPLNSLVAFSSAAKHLSFTRASEELHVTQGAISRQVRHLEDYLEQALFIREKRSLRLTAIGQQYYAHVQPALSMIASATSQVLESTTDNQITIVTSNAMATFWLLPRISEFQALYPQVDLRILAVDSIASLESTEFDIALFYCRKPPQQFKATALFSEVVYPVCSPAYLANNPQIQAGDALLEGTLLSLEIDEECFSWKELFSACHKEYRPEAYRQLKINNYPLIIQSALNGQGLALAWSNLVDEYLDSGLLVRPIEAQVTTKSQFYMLEPAVTSNRQGVNDFKQWLLSIL